MLNMSNLGIQPFITPNRKIQSGPVRVCFCSYNLPDCNYHHQPVYVTKGETFTVSLVAVDQVNNTIPNSIILSSLQIPAKIAGEHAAQETNTNGSCTKLTYSIISPHNFEKLGLYAKGPCMDIGISMANLTIYIKPCPVGFTDAHLHCDCDTTLYNIYISNCSIDYQSVLRKDNAWFSYINTTDHPNSYTFHKHCPFDYCRLPTERIYIDLNVPDGVDVMCAYNRSGKLCGSCKKGLSLSLGSSRCKACSNKWLALIITFAAAGIALVAFILVCNLTVTVGSINGIIFYANIIAANRAIFLPIDKPNVLTIFMAWLNLDFGYETCFYDGMDGYAKTWLQLVFPLYIISLVIAIIVISEHSIRFAALFTAGKDPIGTLATLVLLSYAKVIRTIIASLSFTTLEYSDGTEELVWLTDANVPYLKGKHIPLFLIALLSIVVGVTYTFLVLGWQWIQLCPNIRPFTWITKNTRLITFMDVYHKPYKKHHRYWIGLLLLARVVLYSVSAVNVLGDPRINLLSITTAVGVLFLLQVAVLHDQNIHKTRLIHILENISLTNLIGFTSLTFYITEYRKSQPVVANYISISIAFITFLVILMCHTCMFVLKKLFQRFTESLRKTENLANQLTFDQATTDDNNDYEEEMVSVTEINALPEPIDTDEDQLVGADNGGQTQSKLKPASATLYIEASPNSTQGSDHNSLTDGRKCKESKQTTENDPHTEFTHTGHFDVEMSSMSTSKAKTRIELHLANEDDDEGGAIWGDETTPLLMTKD